MTIAVLEDYGQQRESDVYRRASVKPHKASTYTVICAWFYYSPLVYLTKMSQILPIALYALSAEVK